MKTKEKPLTKKQKTLNWLLAGKSISGREFGTKLNIENYRDIIYYLRKDLKAFGLEIIGVREPHSDGYHNRWFIPTKHIETYQKIMREQASNENYI